MNPLRDLLSDEPGTLSLTRAALLLVLLLLLMVIGRWLLTGGDVPEGIRALMEVALGSTLVAKVGQKFAEK